MENRCAESDEGGQPQSRPRSMDAGRGHQQGVALGLDTSSEGPIPQKQNVNPTDPTQRIHGEQIPGIEGQAAGSSTLTEVEVQQQRRGVLREGRSTG